ncbi:MAG: magnesium/cobalt transporter CorA [Chloroflexi bacterium]|nr:magnesium/cobalt transporter CorA [Chloroflexota bacterium]
MPFKAYYMTPGHSLHKDLDEAAVAEALRSGQGLLWLDIVETKEEDALFLRRVFGFHPLAVEDCLSELVHAPKVDDYDDYLFILTNGVNYRAQSHVVETNELDLFLGRNYVVSNHNFQHYSVDEVKAQVEATGGPMSKGADYLLHSLLDSLTANVIPAMDTLTDEVDALEEEIVSRPERARLDIVLSIKRSTVRIQRRIAPGREVLNRLSRGEFALVSPDAARFFRDVYDRAVWVEGVNNAISERADHTMMLYLSSFANRQNESIRLLSIVTVIFMPLMLIAAIYGMNFHNMPELKWKYGYFSMLGVMAVFALGISAIFWGKRWITWGRSGVRKMTPLTFDLDKVRGVGEKPKTGGLD